MKIIKITQKDNIFSVTQKPNFIEGLFGIKQTVSQYKDSGYVFSNFWNRTAYINQSGEYLGATNEITKAIENWRRKF